MRSPSSVELRKKALRPREEWWSNQYHWLKEKGYTLRPRYHPDWVPPWKGDPSSSWTHEEAMPSKADFVLDATRDKDGACVMLKLIRQDVNPDEVEISTYLSSEPLASDPKNHCVPICEALKLPRGNNSVIIVMPLLLRHQSIPWDTFGEVVDFIAQLYEGLQFMHKCRIAHRDCMTANIMMDAEVYPGPWHPQSPMDARNFSHSHKPVTRTQSKKPVRYYLIDFGISERYSPDDENPMAMPCLSGDTAAPEFVAGGKGGTEWLGLKTPYNPFPTDVYYIGNFIRQEFITGWPLAKAKRGFDFMKPLIDDMVQDNPSKRPTMDEVVKRFDIIKSELSTRKLRSRVREKQEILSFIPREIGHWKRRIGYILTGVSPTSI